MNLPARSVGKIAREAVLAVLRDDTHGINAAIGQLATEARIDWDDLELDEEEGPDLFVGQYDIERLLESGDLSPDPMTLVVYTGERRNGVGIKQKNCLFAGTVSVQMEAHLTWLNSHPVKSETWLDVLDGAFTYIFNRRGLTWPQELGYNGDVDIIPGPVQFGAQNWRVVVRISLSFTARVA